MAAPCRFRFVAVAASEKAHFSRSCPMTLMGIRRAIRGLRRWPPLTGMRLALMEHAQIRVRQAAWPIYASHFGKVTLGNISHFELPILRIRIPSPPWVLGTTVHARTVSLHRFLR